MRTLQNKAYLQSRNLLLYPFQSLIIPLRLGSFLPPAQFLSLEAPSRLQRAEQSETPMVEFLC